MGTSIGGHVLKLEDIQPVPIEKLLEVAAMAPDEEKPQRKHFDGDKTGRLNVAAYLDRYGIPYRIKQDGGRTIHNLDHCLFDESHIRNEASIIQDVSGLVTYQCFHNSCQGRTWHDAKAKISGDDSLALFVTGTATVSFADTTPLDIFGSTTLAGEPEIPLSAIPKVVANYAEDEAERIGVQPCMVAMAAITAAAACITDDYKIQPKLHDTRWQESARLWIATVADVGQKKTPSLRSALEPVQKIEADLYQKYSYEHEMFERKMEVWKSNRNKDLDDRPEPPLEPRIIVNDATIEALSDILAANPRGVLCVQDELSGWFGTFDAYRPAKSASMDRPAWIRLYDGGPQGIDRVKRGRVWVQNWSACLYGGIQPGPMQRLMGKIIDDGLVQRFVVYYGKKTGEGIDLRPDYTVIDNYRSTINHLFKMQPEPHQKVVRLTPEAHQYFQLVSETAENVMLLPDTSPAFKGHLAKWPGFFSRLLLTYHVTEAAAQGLKQPPEYVEEHTAAQVARLMIDFLLPNAARFYVELMGNKDHLAHARWIAGHILANKFKKITARDIYRAYREFRSDLEGADHEGINRAMAGLVIAGWVKPLGNNKRGYYTRWEVNPAVYSIFAEKANTEKQRREEIKTSIQQAAEFLKLT
jgi:hypothetical protein